MKIFAIYLIGGIVIAIIVLLFLIKGKIKRSSQSIKTNLDRLKPGKAFYEEVLPIPFNAEILKRIEAFLVENKFRLISGVENGIISYSGKSENAALKGWLNIDPMHLPIRIVFKSNGSGTFTIRMDDDYGFQVLNPAQQQKFQQLNEIKFNYYLAQIKKNLSIEDVG